MELNKNILEAIKYAYEQGKITYEQIPKVYRDEIDKGDNVLVGHWIEAKVGE